MDRAEARGSRTPYIARGGCSCNLIGQPTYILYIASHSNRPNHRTNQLEHKRAPRRSTRARATARVPAAKPIAALTKLHWINSGKSELLAEASRLGNDSHE